MYVLEQCDSIKKRSNFKRWYNEFTTKHISKKEVLLVNKIT